MTRRAGSAAALLALLALVATGGAEGAKSTRAAIAGSVPSWATADREVGAAKGTIDFSLVLRWRNEHALEAFDRAVSDPASPAYADYLSPAEFRRRFSPRRSDVRRVRRFLTSRGFEVTGVSASRMLVDATGTVGRAERAFRTSLRIYRYRGRKLRAPAKSLSVPAGLGVRTIIGLDESFARPLLRSSAVPPPPLFRNAPPCSNFWSQNYPSRKAAPFAHGQRQPWVPCGYEPDQLQGAYGIDEAIRAGNDGSGETVAITDAFASPTIRHDANLYSLRHGLPPVRLRQKIISGHCKRNCPIPLRQGWFGEETLDVEAVHTMAPGAKILYVGAPNPGPGLVRALSWVVDHHAASIVTNSWGDLGEQDRAFQALEQTFSEAIAEGIGLYFSSGDNGDELDTIGFVSADYPGSSPHVTSVGGTTLAVGPLDNYSFELGWGTYRAEKTGDRWSPRPPGPFLYGGGGGTSRLFTEPRYQYGVVPRTLAGRYGGRGRVSPDISLDGDPTTGMLVGETQTFPSGRTAYSESRAGGTSLSSPLFAGFMALADQRAGFDHGFVNPALYSLYRSHALHDIRPPRVRIALVRRDFANGANRGDGFITTLRTVGPAGSLRTDRGYDNLTGLGSPRGGAMLRALARR